MYKTVSLLAMFLAANILPAQTPQAILQKSLSAYSSAEGIRADFAQVLKSPMTGNTYNSRGILQRSREGLFSLDFTDPKEDRIVKGPTTFWLYLPSTIPGSAASIPSDSPMIRSFDLFSFLSPSVSSAFLLTAAPTDRFKITLTPLGSSSPLRNITLQIDSTTFYIQKIDITEPTGMIRSITLTNTRRSRIPASAFVFTPPPGVRIISSRSIGSDRP